MKRLQIMITPTEYDELKRIPADRRASKFMDNHPELDHLPISNGVYGGDISYIQPNIFELMIGVTSD